MGSWQSLREACEEEEKGDTEVHRKYFDYSRKLKVFDALRIKCTNTCSLEETGPSVGNPKITK